MKRDAATRCLRSIFKPPPVPIYRVLPRRRSPRAPRGPPFDRGRSDATDGATRHVYAPLRMSHDATASLVGTVALVTGANSGIGRVTARELAQMGAHVFLACRSETKTQPVIDEIKRASSRAEAEFLPLDLSDFASIRRCAETFLQRNVAL